MNRPMHVCIVGPDGVGKTTIANRVFDALVEEGLEVVRLNARPKSVDTITNQDFDYTDPHALPPRNMARSLAKAGLKFGYAWTQLGRAHLRGTSQTVLLEERGWVDHGVDHRRYRIHPTASKAFIAAAPFAPGPDRTIILTGDPAAITVRKNELDLTEVTRQLELWTSLHHQGCLGNSTLLDTTENSVDDTVTAALNFLLDRVPI